MPLLPADGRVVGMARHATVAPSWSAGFIAVHSVPSTTDPLSFCMACAASSSCWSVAHCCFGDWEHAHLTRAHLGPCKYSLQVPCHIRKTRRHCMVVGYLDIDFLMQCVVELSIHHEHKATLV